MSGLSTPAMLGIAAAAYYFLVYQPNQAAQQAALLQTVPPSTDGSTSTTGAPTGVTVTQTIPNDPTTTVAATAAPATSSNPSGYPYLVDGAPPMPNGYDQTYYLNYIYPAMIAINQNVQNPGFVFPDGSGFANNYIANYLSVAQWISSFNLKTAEEQHDKAVQHWQMYGCAQQRTFLPLPWANTSPYIPPPPAPKQSSGLFGTILKAVTVVGAGVAIVASGGALAPVVAPAAGLALSAESSIHGVDDLPLISDSEAEILFTGSAILKDILPMYNQADKKSVKMLNNKLTTLLNHYS